MKIFLFCFILTFVRSQDIFESLTSTISSTFQEKADAINEFTAAITKLWSKPRKVSDLSPKSPTKGSSIEFKKMEPNEKFRTLQSSGSSSCSNNSVSVNAMKVQYYCNNKEVNKINYQSLSTNLSNNCNSNSTLISQCYCPIDFLGVYCQINNKVRCSVKDSFNDNCPKYDSYYYNSRWDGDAPCKKATRVDVVDFDVKLDCKNVDQSSLTEGIKADGEFNPNSKPTFSYSYNTTSLS